MSLFLGSGLRLKSFISLFLLLLLFSFHSFVCFFFWGCGIFRAALTCERTSVCPGCAARARIIRRLATCIWPRSSEWTQTGLQSQPPPLKPSPVQKMAPPIRSWSSPSTPPRQLTLSNLSLRLQETCMHTTRVQWMYTDWLLLPKVFAATSMDLKISQENQTSQFFSGSTIHTVSGVSCLFFPFKYQ